MSRLDFHIEFYDERINLSNALKDEAESRLRALAAERNDLIGASIGGEELVEARSWRRRKRLISIRLG